MNRPSANPEEPKSYVDLEQLEQHLLKIERLIRQLQKLNRILEVFESLEIEIEEDDYQHLAYITRFNKAFHRASYNFYSKLDTLERFGAQVKDLEEGIVDFLYYFEGRDIFLCWKLGEKTVAHWHEIDGDFSERKKIVDLSKQVE